MNRNFSEENKTKKNSGHKPTKFRLGKNDIIDCVFDQEISAENLQIPMKYAAQQDQMGR